MITCNECGISKEEYEFYKRKSGSVRRECKSCLSIKNKQRLSIIKIQTKETITEKLCVICNKKYDINHFVVTKIRKDGYSNKCKDCLKEYRKSDVIKSYLNDKKNSGRQNITAKNYRNKHRDVVTARQKNYRDLNQEQIKKNEKEKRFRIRNEVLSKLGNSCVVCGESERSFLSIDHIHNDGKLDREKFSNLYNFLSHINKLPEINQKYQVMCHNHNREKQIHLLNDSGKDDGMDNRIRKCSVCNRKKKFGEFPLDKYKSTGRKSECKECCTERHKLRKKQAIELLGGKCSCCGNNNLDHLEIDHINNDGSIRRKNKLDMGIYLKILAMKDVGHLQILCCNCNMSKAILGQCEHVNKQSQYVLPL
jgi:hypothetical protein